MHQHKVIATRDVGSYTIQVCEYEHDLEDYQLLLVMKDGVVLLEHPQDHQARITLQASSYLLGGKWFFFAESWLSREQHGEVLLPYDIHLSRLELPSLRITTHFHTLELDAGYSGIDVDSSQSYLLITWSMSKFTDIQIVDYRKNELIDIDCIELGKGPFDYFRWGETLDKVIGSDDVCEYEYELLIDWERHYAMWSPEPLSLSPKHD